MFSPSSKAVKKGEQLPPLPSLSPSPPRTSKDRDAHILSGHSGTPSASGAAAADRPYISLPVPATCLAALATSGALDADHFRDNQNRSSISSGTLASRAAGVCDSAVRYRGSDAVISHLITQPVRGSQGSFASGGAPPLPCLTLSGMPGLHSDCPSAAKAPASGEECIAEEPLPRSSSVRTSDEGKRCESPQLLLHHLQCSSSRSSNFNGSGTSHPNVTAPQTTCNIMFSSVESGPHVPATHSAAAASAHLPAMNTAEESDVSVPRPAVVPHAGVFLQPSTFRIGATGEDVLWALYQTNGFVASYLDPPCDGGYVSSGGHGAPAAEATQRQRSSSCTSRNKQPHAGAAPAVTLATHTVSALYTDAQASSGGSNSNNNSCGIGSSQAVPSFADVEAEIARCLNGAGSSTPCLLSFDYVVRPARVRHLTDAELAALRHHPLFEQLTAEGVNSMEAAVPGPSQQPPYTPLTTNTTAAEGEGGDAPEQLDHDHQQRQHQQQLQRWGEDILDLTASADLSGTFPDLRRLRRRACGEVVQSCLHAARRASSPQRQLYLSEPITAESGCGGSGSATGTVYRLLSGSTVAEGSRLLPSPLWSGVHIALATMLVGETATFVLGSGDATRYTAPVDGTTCVRGDTSAAASTCDAAAAMTPTALSGGSRTARSGGGGGVASTSMRSNGAGTTGDAAARRHYAHFTTDTDDHHRELTFNALHTRRGSSFRHGHTHARGGTHAGRRRRSRSNSTSSHCRSLPARTSSSLSADNGREGKSKGPRRISTTAPQSPVLPTHPPQRKQSTFLSRVRNWRKKGRSSSTSSCGGEEAKANGQSEKNGAAAPPPPPLQPHPPPPHTSPTRTRPPSRCRSSAQPTGTPTSASVTSASDSPFETSPGSVSVQQQQQQQQQQPPTPRPPQRGGTPTHGCPAPLPTFAPIVPADVRAYAVAMHGAAEPLMVELRLRERIPLLPTRSTSVLPSLLVSAELASGGGGVTTGSSPSTPIPPSGVPPDGVCGRVASNLSAGAVSASTVATSLVSESGQRRGLVTDALLCLGGSNLMRPHLATAFHHLFKGRGEGSRGRGSSGVTAAAAAAAAMTPMTAAPSTSRHSFPSTPSRRASSSVSSNKAVAAAAASPSSLLQLITFVLDRAGVRKASRAALFCAMMYVMDGKLLNTRDRAHVLESAAGAEAIHQESPHGAAGGPPSADDVGAQVVLPRSYRWLPYFRVADVFTTFARHWHSGAFAKRESTGRANTKGPRVSAISSRALQHTLEEFTRYPHDTATVTYSVAVFNTVTQSYDPCTTPLWGSATAAATATATRSTAMTTSPLTHSTAGGADGEDGRKVRGFIGCVMQPSWLDAVLQLGQKRGGDTDILVVTRGHAAEAAERLFICSILSDITATALNAAAAFSPSSTSTAMLEDVTATPKSFSKTLTSKEVLAATSAVGGVGVLPKQPKTPTGTSTRPVVAERVTDDSVRTPTTRTSPPMYTRSRASIEHAEKAEAAARRSLAAGRQLLQRRVGEQHYRLRVSACAQVLTPQHFFASSPKEGLAAARALLVDAAVLLDYYHRVMDSFGAAGPRSLRLSAAVPLELRSGARLRTRSQHARQRLPYLLFGDERAAILAAATSQAAGMGATHLSPTTTTAAAAAATAGAGSDTPSNPHAGAISPPIEVLAAALMFFAPSAASAAPTLAIRIPLALERVLLKVLPMLYLAIFVLSFGVDEAEAEPTALIEHVYGAWWAQAAATGPSGTPPSLQRSAAEKAAPTPAAAAAAGPSTTPLPPPQHQSTPPDEQSQALYRRYTYLGECFHYLTLVYAELPGVRAMSYGACCMALFYFPRDADLWALWASLSEQQGGLHEAAAARQVSERLAAMADERAWPHASSGSGTEGAHA